MTRAPTTEGTAHVAAQKAPRRGGSGSTVQAIRSASRLSVSSLRACEAESSQRFRVYLIRFSSILIGTSPEVISHLLVSLFRPTMNMPFCKAGLPVFVDIGPL